MRIADCGLRIVECDNGSLWCMDRWRRRRFKTDDVAVAHGERALLKTAGGGEREGEE